MKSLVAVAVIALAGFASCDVVTEIAEYDGLQMYTTINADVAGNPTRAAIWASDQFGWDGGRTREMADRLAEETDFLVIVPDFFGGEADPDPFTYKWHEEMQYAYYDRVRRYVNGFGIDRGCVSVGQGIGSYIVVHLGVDFMIRAGFVTSPEHVDVIDNYDDEDELELYSPGISNSLTGIYFGLTPDDGDDYREGSQADVRIDDLTIKEYPCSHGFFTQGDLSDPQVEQCVDEAFQDLLDFIANYV